MTIPSSEATACDDDSTSAAVSPGSFDTCVVFMLGYPGMGKRTIGSHLAGLLDGVLVDNALINRPVLELFRWDGVELLPPGVFDYTSPILDTVLAAIEDLAPPSNSYVFTNVIEAGPTAVDEYDRIRSAAHRRGSLFLAVMLTCDIDAQVSRIDNPDRIALRKGSDPEGYRGHRLSTDLYQPSPAEVLHLDTTSTPPGVNAERIYRELRDRGLAPAPAAGRVAHRLLDPTTVERIEAAASAHAGRAWRMSTWTDLSDRSSHPAMIMRDESLAVFAKLATPVEAASQLTSELAGLRLVAASGVRVPEPIGSGRVDLPDGSTALLLEALDERVDRTPTDWQHIGRSLAQLHSVEGQSYGAPTNGYFGPLLMDNSPVGSNTWTEFYAVRRVLPYLRTARDAGSVDATTTAKVEALVARLPELAGPDPGPRLLHGDAQHHNFLSTDAGAVMIDVSPYFGHPELDLALLDYFAPVPPETWASYTEIRPIDEGFAQRRELWRVFAYLGILTVDTVTDLGRSFHSRLQHALGRYL